MDVSAHDESRPAAPDCPFLEIPVELMIIVGRYLPVPNRMILAQTCRPMWNILHEHLRVDLRSANRDSQLPRNPGLARNAKLEYLLCLARGNPNRWLCATCQKLHPVTDTQVERSKEPCHVWNPYRLDFPGMSLQYCHIQLAHKYNRMGGENPTYQRRLQKLLAPHHHDSWFPDDHEDCRSSREPAGFFKRHFVKHFTLESKLIGGKFLIHSVWDCNRLHAEEPVTLDALKSLMACQHMRAPQTPSSPCFQQHVTLVSIIVGAMAKRDGSEMRGSCPWCATDFSVESTPNRLRLRAWRDLGSEDSPLNPVLRGQFNYLTRLRNYTPGTVRDMYESVA